MSINYCVVQLFKIAQCYKIFPMKKPNIVGDNIRRLRLKAGLTQEEVALRSGLSQGYINQLESGKRRFTQKTLEIIADALSINMIELFKEDDTLRVPFATEKVERYKIKPHNKRDFLTLLNELPKHIVEHYFILLKFEREIWKKKDKK